MMTSFFELSSPRSHILEKPKLILKDSLSAIQDHVSHQQCACILVTLFLQLFLVLLFTVYTPKIAFLIQPHQQERVISMATQAEKCNLGWVYVYDLPPMFNKELLENCDDLDPLISWCTAISHEGFGPRAETFPDVLPHDLRPTWYWTEMYAGEVIYHNRISNYKCRTSNPESATAFYVPFYAGLAVGKYLYPNHTTIERDWHSEMLNSWLQDQPFWKRSNGSDHFIMLGRMTWDFRRSNGEEWGTSFLKMPAMKEVLRLSVERCPWDNLEISVPYPTGFHPRSTSDTEEWQRFVRERKRRTLFTFVGGKRNVKNDFRGLLLDHCYNETGSCRAVDCSNLRCSYGTWTVLEAFLDSNFCLQPRGDTYTRRSTFDCILAGSIPVFFWEQSFRGQYEWFLTDQPESFSVFIDRNDVRNGTSVRRVLERYSVEEVKKKREKVISLIPMIIYGMYSDREDAFDITIEGVLKKFHKPLRS